VRVGLVADIPDQAVPGRVEDVVQGDGQLDHPQAGAKVPATLPHAVEQELTQFVGQRDQLGFAQAAQLSRRGRAVEQRRDGALAGDLVERLRH